MIRALLFLAASLALLLVATRWGDPHPLAVDASADCAPVELVNPCDVIDCNLVNPKEIS